MLKKARFAKPIGQVMEIERMERPPGSAGRSDKLGSAGRSDKPGSAGRSDKPGSAGKGGKRGSPPTRRRDTSPPKSAGSQKSQKSPSPNRKSKPTSAGSRKSAGGDFKSAMRKGSAKETKTKKDKKKTVVKSPDLTEDGLKIIDMSGQGMTVLPLSILGAKDIGVLCLASNNLRSLPIEVKRLTTLTKLDISRNGIRCTNPNDFSGLPTELSLLVNLYELKISECNLPYIPPAIWQMEQLRSLDISRNKINTLLPDVGKLINLQKLNLQQTNITTLPPEIAYCQELEEILLWGNVIESLPETLPEMLKLRTLAVNYRSFCAQLDSFHESEELLRKGKLTSEHIPLVVFELATLQILDLESTKINTVPEMSNISLQELYLCKNFLSKVPPSLFNLNHLTILDMSNNLLNVLPDNIGNITSLNVLRISSNQIERIPPRIRELINLEELNVAENRIHYIPSAIGGLKKLKALYVEKNDLTSLPDEICDLENLETLDITENRISALPMKMHQLKNLADAHSFQRLSKHGLWLYKNPIVQPPPEIWKTERPEKIFEYLKKLAIIKTENLQKQKIFAFGESGSGKTSLINGLLHRKSMMTRGDEDKTRALQQSPWKTENNVEFMIHDFGGDNAYTMIYPMFSDSKSLALIVYDHSTYSTETHQAAIGRWIDFFNVYMPGVVVKLVGTHLDNFEEYAILEEPDENGNIMGESRMTSRCESQTFSRLSARSLHSGRSAYSDHSDLLNNDESLAEGIPNQTSTPTSRASSHVSQSKVTEDLVKTNVAKQMENYTKILQNELIGLETQLGDAVKDSKSSNKVKHLTAQKKKVESMIAHPVRIVPNIGLVSSNNGLYGFTDLIESLELMVIDKSLFPHAQRSIPDKWNKLRATLKQNKSYYLPWTTVQQCGAGYGIHDEELLESLQYFSDTGDILWFRTLPSLSNLIFHKPRILVDLLSAMFRHDVENFLDFDTNKVFMSKGMFEPDDFENAKDLFLRNGQISRPLMNCFWFYQELNYDRFNELLDLVPLLDVCYSIPEPAIPTGQLYSYPITVLPWYNQESSGSEFEELWNESSAELTDKTSMSAIYSLPLGLPDGIFEKLVSILQTHVLTRIDWKDTIFAMTENEIFHISLIKEMKTETAPLIDTPEEVEANVKEHTETEPAPEIKIETCPSKILIKIVGKNGNGTGALSLVKELTSALSDLLLRIPGLVWTLSGSDTLWESSALSYNLKTVQFADK